MSNVLSILEEQLDLIGPNAKVIFDVGAQSGQTTLEYLTTFLEARVFSFEPDVENFSVSRQAIASYAQRCSLHFAALSDTNGTAQFHVNSHNGTHSLLPIGGHEYFKEPSHEVKRVIVPVRTLDSFAAEHSVSSIDIVKMDIQGGELAALKGAAGLLGTSKIKLLALEVEFKPMYQDQPLFWDICAYLHEFGYSFFKFYEPIYHARNKNMLCWADAIFLSPSLTRLPLMT
jgi:FkbM family methyltransferase